MTLADRLENTFVLNTTDGPTLYTNNGYEFYAFNDCSEFGVFLQIGSAVEDVDERFADVRFYTRNGYLGVNGHLAVLSCADIRYASRFASLCTDLVDPGKKGEKRTAVIRDPLSWWDDWKNLLGNRIADQRAYSVLGEMMSVDYLTRKGYAPKWEGLKHGVRDIVGNGYSVEVKSTLERYSRTIEAAGQFQFEEDTESFLFFCRFEESESGISIDHMADVMILDGCMSRPDIESLLEATGLPRGRTARKRKFRLLEMTAYRIDESFPRITAESFKGNQIPRGVSHIEYTVDLEATEVFETLVYDPENP